ncbi:hypothetical protein GGF46_005142 [Coemansia sp. RSA 552]|nr:hypothetical protein GGF46_005142 [Coemansia sp. RSA 552]
MEKQTATSAVSGVSPEQSAGSQRSHGNIVAGEHGCGYNVLSTTNANVAAGMAAGSGGSPMRSAFGTAVSDIYDCVATGKRQGAQMEFTDQPTTGFTTIPARAAAKREAISFDHIKAQQSLPHSATYRNTYHEGRTRDGTQPEVVSVEYASGAILDTNSANPSIKAPSSKSQTGIKIKPRRLVRDNKKRPDNAKLSKASVARPADDLKNKITVIHNEWATAPHYLQQLAPPHHGPQGLVAEIGQSLQPHNSSLPGHIPRRSRDRPHTEPPSPTTDGQHPNPRKSANFLSLVDSIESLSDTYQFAVRHKPPLGPFHVIEPHMPGLPDELRIRRGEEIYVMGEFADSWVLAINVSQTNECGMIPRRCLYFPSTKFMTSKARPDDAVSPDQDTATTH